MSVRSQSFSDKLPRFSDLMSSSGQSVFVYISSAIGIHELALCSRVLSVLMLYVLPTYLFGLHGNCVNSTIITIINHLFMTSDVAGEMWHCPEGYASTKRALIKVLETSDIYCFVMLIEEAAM